MRGRLRDVCRHLLAEVEVLENGKRLWVCPECGDAGMLPPEAPE